MAEPFLATTTVEVAAQRSLVRAAVVALRPRQWTKNLLVFAGILFAAELDDATRWGQALLAFAAYCAASSAAYLVNDVRDVARDRLHPVKCGRPIASGDLGTGTALVLAAALAVAGLGLTAALGWPSLACMACFLGLQAAYTARLKTVILADVAVIAALFVIRAVAGAVAVDVRISPWLPVCAGLLALLLALGKRRAELALVGTRSRVALEGYSLQLLDQLLAGAAAATVAAYVAYALTARDSKALVASVPLVVVGVVRYLVLVQRRGMGEEPERLLWSDPPLLATVGAWAALCAATLALAT